MSGAEIGVILTGLGTFAAAAIGALRALRSDKATEAERRNTSLMAGYEGLMESLREDMRRLREEHEAARQAWEVERRAWAEERARLSAEIAQLKSRVRELERHEERREQ